RARSAGRRPRPRPRRAARGRVPEARGRLARDGADRRGPLPPRARARRRARAGAGLAADPRAALTRRGDRSADGRARLGTGPARRDTAAARRAGAPVERGAEAARGARPRAGTDPEDAETLIATTPWACAPASS